MNLPHEQTVNYAHFCFTPRAIELRRLLRANHRVRLEVKCLAEVHKHTPPCCRCLFRSSYTEVQLNVNTGEVN